MLNVFLRYLPHRSGNYKKACRLLFSTKKKALTKLDFGCWLFVLQEPEYTNSPVRLRPNNSWRWWGTWLTPNVIAFLIVTSWTCSTLSLTTTSCGLPLYCYKIHFQAHNIHQFKEVHQKFVSFAGAVTHATSTWALSAPWKREPYQSSGCKRLPKIVSKFNVFCIHFRR